MPPGTPAGQHEHPRGEDRAVVDRCCSSALWARGERRNQALSQCPQLVGHQVSGQGGYHKK